MINQRVNTMTYNQKYNCGCINLQNCSHSWMVESIGATQFSQYSFGVCLLSVYIAIYAVCIIFLSFS